MIASEAPTAADGTDARYVPQACAEAAGELFAAPTIWIPQDDRIRQALESSGVSQTELAPVEMPGVVDVRRWRAERTGFRSSGPVVGRHSRDSSTVWPRDPETLLQVYPNSPEFDIRVLGGAERAREVLGGRALPSNWLVYDDEDIDVNSFLFQLDFWVYFPDAAEAEGLNREILEALASGCVVILPDRFSGSFGDAAVYRHAAEVKGTIQTYYRQPELFLEQSHRARRRVAEWFSPTRYLEQITALSRRAAPASGESRSREPPNGVLPAGASSPDPG